MDVPDVPSAAGLAAGAVIVLAYIRIIRSNAHSRREMIWTLVPALLLLGLILVSAREAGVLALLTRGP